MKYFSSDVINILNFTSGHPNLEHINTEQECVPVGCVLLAQVAIPSGMPPPPHHTCSPLPCTLLCHTNPCHTSPLPCTSPCHMCTPWHACCLAVHTTPPCHACPPRGQTGVCENITLPYTSYAGGKNVGFELFTLNTFTSVLLI